MSEQEALEAFFAEWDRQANEYGASLTREQRDCAEEAWNAALAWLRSQGEPVAWRVVTREGKTRCILEREPLREQFDLGETFVPLFLAPQPAIPDGWQPIETAPQDFEPFDVWSARHGRIPDCVDGVTTYGKKRGIVFQSGYDSDGPVMDLIEDATHWMRVAAPEPRK